MVRLLWSRSFEKSFRKLSPDLQDATFRTVDKLIDNPKRPSLKLERLQGTSNYWSVRVNSGCRMILCRGRDEQGDFFALVSVGPHDVYRRL